MTMKTSTPITEERCNEIVSGAIARLTKQLKAEVNREVSRQLQDLGILKAPSKD